MGGAKGAMGVKYDREDARRDARRRQETPGDARRRQERKVLKTICFLLKMKGSSEDWGRDLTDSHAFWGVQRPKYEKHGLSLHFAGFALLFMDLHMFLVDFLIVSFEASFR